MKLIKNMFRLASLLCLLAANQILAQDSNVGVTVKIWGKTASANPNYGNESELDISGTAMETYPGAGNGTIDVEGTTFSQGVIFYTDVGTFHFELNKTYLITAHGINTTNTQELHVVAPPGYSVEIDGVQRPLLFLTTTSHTYSVRILGGPAPSPRAGEAASLEGNQVDWQVSLGSLQNGTSAGALSLINSATGSSWASLFTPAALDYLPPSAEIQVFRDGSGNIKQVLANQAVVNVVTNSSTQYDIFFYHPGQLSGSSYPYSFTGRAYVQYRVEQPSGATTTLQITKYTRNLTGYTDDDTSAPIISALTAVTTVQRSGSSPNFTWTLHDWNTSGQAQLTERVLSSTGAVTPSDTRTESLVVQVPSGAVATQASSTFNYYSWGEEPATQTAGTGTGLTTTLVHYDSYTTPGSTGYLKSAVTAGGGWEAYDYWNPTAGTNFTGAVKYRYRPYNNSPSTVTQDPTQGEVTYFEYVNDAFGFPTRPSLVQTSINNVVTAKTSTSYTTAAHSSSSTLTVVTATVKLYSDTTNYLTTVSKYFQEDAGLYTASEVFYRGQPFSLTNPDQTKVSYSYEHGTFNESTHAFTSSSSGTASRTAVITGSASSSAGSLCSSYGSFDVDDLYVVDGKSTLAVTIRDSRGLVRRTESYAWSSSAWNLIGYVDLVYDYAGQLTSSVTSNGATTTCVYNGDQKTSETDASGVTVSYTYDYAGRLLTKAKSSGPTTTVAYDAAGRVLSETVSASGTGETIYSARTYDSAGRLATETPVAMSAITYSYDVSGRSQTATYPDTSTRTEYFNLDGQLEHVGGSAVVPQYNIYTRETDGRRTVQSYASSSGSARWQKSTVDWLGRSIHAEHPGFSISSQAVSADDNIYDPSNGRLIKTTHTGLAPTLFQYDALGHVIRTGLDVNNDDSLGLNSTDRITDADEVFEYSSSAWWLKATTMTYPFASTTPVTTSIKRTRLTGHSTGRFDETQVTDAEGNTVTRTVDVNRGTATTTITTTRPGVANTQTETIVNGLATSATGHDGLTTTAQYDPLNRAWKSTDSRNNTFTTTYKNGTGLVQSVSDGAGNTLSTVSYDSNMGRKQWVQDANNQYTHFAYNLRGQLTYQWGGGAYPVSYGYDTTYGDRTTLNTYRSDTTSYATDPGSWPSGTVGTPDSTTWTYDGASGLLWKKTDALGQVTEFDYNVRGQTSIRKWARMLTTTGMTTTAVKTTYGYDSNTGELLTQTYNDTAETIPTPPVTYTYNRLGQVATVADGTGSRTFNYNGSAPWRMDSEALDATFYASRLITRQYDSSSGTGGSYGGYTPGTFKGRYIGYDLGVSGNTARDQHIAYTTSNLGRFVGVNTRTTTGSARDYVYNYYTASSLSSSLIGGYSMGSFSVTRAYETYRDVLTSLDSQWSGASVTRYDYTTNALGQRTTAKQKGSAFSDYNVAGGGGYSATYNVYKYNTRGELETARRYRGDSPTTSPSTADELPAQRFEYRFDSIGNRKTSGATGTTVDDNYTTNELNQYKGNSGNGYTARENKTVKVIGTADLSANVAVKDAPSTGKKDHAWGADLVPANTSGPEQATATVYASLPGTGTAGADVVRTDTRGYVVPKRAQVISYDADGNMTDDGVWTYAYNAENQLVQMLSKLPFLTGYANRWQLDFKYDYLGRRVQKTVVNPDDSAKSYTQRYLYDGNNLIAQTDASGNLQRTFTWGLDLAASLSATGGVGALLHIEELTSPAKSLSVAYDGNGNVAALVNSTTGALEAGYEYDPSGGLLRAEGSYAKTNPFRFSSKWQDDETGLINYGVRYYSPTLGRFINRDPIGEKGGLNLYGFCGNDGINRTDYLGYSWLSKLLNASRRLFWGAHRAIMPIKAVRRIETRLEKWGDDHQQELKTAVILIVSLYTGGAASAWAETAQWSPAAQAALGGAVTGATSSTLSGGSASDILRGTLIGGFTGGISSKLHGITNPYLNAAGHAALGGAASVAQGGSFFSGALSSGVATSIGGGYFRAAPNSRILRTLMAAAVGGATSRLTGGSFLDGALSSGIQWYYNAERKIRALVEESRYMLTVMSNVAAQDGVELIAGHSALAVYDSVADETHTYGLWPDDHSQIVAAGLSNGSGSDIRVDFYRDDPSRYKYQYSVNITDAQYSSLMNIVSSNQTWRLLTNNCSGFSSRTFIKVTGISISARDGVFFSTPRAIGDAIIKLNGKAGSPAIPNEPSTNSSSW